MEIRSTPERARRARARLEQEANVWVATASGDGLPHLVPLSLAWLDGRIVVATPSDNATVRNVASNGRARAALDGAGDVVAFDCDVEVVALDAADPSLVTRFVERVGWDPRHESAPWSLLLLSVRRAHAWNGPAEMEGRTIVRHGRWLDA